MRPLALVTGAGGMLGQDMTEALSANYHVIALGRKELDISSPLQVQEVIEKTKPNLVVNCAAFTKVDLCEEEKELAFKVNSKGPGIVASCCNNIGAKLVHISTDYVFDGTSTRPYREDDRTNPINVYGQSKLQGEKEIMEALSDHLIVRTSWLFGKNGPNFIKTMIELSKKTKHLKVVNDQMGRPTYTKDLSEGVLLLLEKGAKGIVNCCNSGKCTWFDLCCHSLLIAGKKDIHIEPVSTKAFPRPAKRPRYSVLSLERFDNITKTPMRHWKQAVKAYIREEGLDETVP